MKKYLISLIVIFYCNLYSTSSEFSTFTQALQNWERAKNQAHFLNLLISVDKIQNPEEKHDAWNITQGILSEFTNEDPLFQSMAQTHVEYLQKKIDAQREKQNTLLKNLAKLDEAQHTLRLKVEQLQNDNKNLEAKNKQLDEEKINLLKERETAQLRTKELTMLDEEEKLDALNKSLKEQINALKTNK